MIAPRNRIPFLLGLVFFGLAMAQPRHRLEWLVCGLVFLALGLRRAQPLA